MRRSAFVILGMAVAAVACAQNYPVKPIRLVSPYPPGGANDILARIVGQKLGENLGQQIVIENRGGATGNIGAEYVAKAAPDGYTILMGQASNLTINVSLMSKMPYDPVRDLAPVTLVATTPNLLVVHPSLPVRTVKELIDLAQARPGAINYASNGAGTLSHLTGELFKLQTGTNLAHIPYKGGPPAVIDLVAGQVSVLFTAIPTAVTQVRAGRLRAIAVTGLKRVDAIKEVPTVAETVPGFESSQWWGMFAPPGTPADIIDKLNAEVARMLVDAEVKARFANEGADAIGGNPREFAAYLKADYEKWGKVVKEAGIRPE